MEPEVSLSCEEIERFLGEEDSRVHALRGVSLQVERGTVHAVVGPSGCGKSTLLYILGLLDRPDSGSLTIDGHLIAELPDDELARKRNELLGFIFQFHFLLEDFTAQENIMIPMRRLGRLSRALAAVPHRPGIRSGRQEELDQLGVPTLGGRMKWRVAVPLLRVDVGPGGDQQPTDLVVASGRG